MRGLWILLGILLGLLLLLLLLLLIPVRIDLRFDRQLNVRLRVLGIPFTVFDGSRESTPKQKLQKKNASQTPAGDAEDSPLKIRLQSLQAALKNEGLAGYLDLCRQLTSYGGKLMNDVHRSFSVRVLRVYYLVAGGDPDEVAVHYGRVSTWLYAAQALLEHHIKVKKREIRLIPDFLADDSALYLDATIRICPMRLLFTVCGCIFRVYGYTNRKITDFEALTETQGG